MPNNMENWGNDAIWAGFAVFMLVLGYVIIHMLYNRSKGRDELENLFRIRKKK
ncbi:MAG TPA: hypothetical protein VGN20_14195 [Mucilaginibacter sp.]|jgi:hypothetical protein